MKNLNLISALFLQLVFSGFASAQPQGFFRANVEILPESRIELRGTTNINRFNCQALQLAPGISAWVKHSPDENALYLQNSTMYVQVNSLECGQEAINRDLRKTLNATEHPEIVIEITRIHFERTADEFPEQVIVNAQMQIAGVENPVCISLASEMQASKGIYQIQGEHSIKLTEFGIDPPRTFFGLIKVEDKIVISFDLLLKQHTDLGHLREALKNRT